VDIAAWLRGLGLGQYEQTFRDNAVDAEILPKLTGDDLREMGVVAIGHRRKLLEAVAALRDGTPAARVDAGEAEVSPGQAPGPPTPQAERRQLSVMFVDLVGSTALSRRLDPEEMREVLRAYQNAVAGEVARFEGHVAKFMGDGVLAYFGWPRAHEDDAERAVRAGLAVAGTVAALPVKEGPPLAARVGIATGLAVVGDLIGSGAAREETVVGETPNLAARLQAVAPPGGVVLAEGTRRLLGAALELEPLGPLELAGFGEPIRAFRVTGEGRAEGRFEAHHAGGSMPLVGREQELALLLDRWRLAKDGEGQIVLLCGEPGIGKSRIVLALRERLRAEPRTSLRYHGSPYHTHSPLWPVIAQLERAAGLEPGDPPDTRLDKLEVLLGQAVDNAAAVAPMLAELLGLPAGSRHPPSRLAPQQSKTQTFRALLAQLEGLARRRPVLVVLEDAQWFDPTTLELFDLVVGRIERLPVLLVVTFRPEFRPPWLGRAHVTLLTLSRLGRSQAAEVVLRVTDGKALPAEVMDRILAKTDGIPLFVEELTKAVLEAGLLREEEGRYVLHGPLPPLAIPDTLHGSLLARLDRMAPVKEVAQIGAVIGREFDHELLAAVAGMGEARLAAALRQLIEAELVFPRGMPPEATYVFKHALVQEAAYGSLLKGRRQQLHARVAEELERRLADAMAPRPEVLAHHLTEAGLAERALEFWGQAGALALARSANQEAVAHLERAVRLVATLPPSEGLKRREIEFQGGLSVALGHVRGLASPEVEQAQLRARELAAEIGDGEGWFRAQWGLWRVYNGRARSGQALEAARELLAAAEQDGDDAYLLQAHHAFWSSMLFRGDFADARAHAERGRSLYDPERHAGHVFVYGGHDPGECALNQGGNALWFLGYPEQASRWHDEAMALSERLGLPQVVAHTLNWTAICAQLAGDLPRLQAQVDRLSRLAAEHGFANWFLEARILAGWIAAQRDRDRGALGPMRRCLDHRSASGTVFARTWLWLVLADACLAVGANAEAIAAAREGLAGAEATEERFCEAELHRAHAAALLAHDRGMLPDAERTLLQALEAARARQARMSELRAATDLARLWADAGRCREAYDVLAPVHAWFTEGLETRELIQAQALLDTLP
jgi:class 3 adenylate cyclase/predicted ATPase